MDKIFKALADETRRMVLDKLLEKPGLNLNELIEGTEMRRQSASKHIKILQEAGLVTAEWRGREKLHFLKRARSLGFAIDDCRKLLSLYEDDHRSSADVRELAMQRIGDIERKIDELEGLKRTLSRLAQACHGDQRPDCPILDDLAGRSI